MMPQQQKISLLIQESPPGGATHEVLPAVHLGGNRYCLLNSPAMVFDVAAGDEIELFPDGKFEIVSRSGNIAIQFFKKSVEESRRADLKGHLVEAFARIGGWLDGESPSMLVFTVSVGVGFPSIEREISRVASHHPTLEWTYGNVYGADGKTPLNWWLKQSPSC